MSCQPMTWMRELRDDLEAIGTTETVLWALALRMDGNTGTGWCSEQTLAQDTGYGLRTVERAVAWAVEHGYLRRVRRGHRLGSGAASATSWALVSTRLHSRVDDAQPDSDAAQPDSTDGSTRLPRRDKGSLEESSKRKDSLTRGEDASASPTATTTPATALFDEFWSVYPKRVAKQAAKRNWARAVKAGTDPHVIIAGAKSYAAAMADKDAQYVKSPDGWLNAGRWDDELPTAGHGGQDRRRDPLPAEGTEHMRDRLPEPPDEEIRSAAIRAERAEREAARRAAPARPRVVVR